VTIIVDLVNPRSEPLLSFLLFDLAHNTMLHDTKTEIAHAAAAFIVEEGMETSAAKKHAVKQLGLRANTPLPDNLRLKTQCVNT